MNKYHDDEVRRQVAAIKIQSLMRGFLFRHNKSQRNFHHHCARIIQKAWRAFSNRKTIQNVIEILALFRLTRAFSRYRIKFYSMKSQERLSQFDQLLGFYPTKSNPPVAKPKTKRRLRKKGSQKSISNRGLKSSRRGSKKDKSQGGSGGSRPPVPEFKGGVPHNRSFGRKPARKKKIIVELPPPWHSKNPRKLSQSQMDDMLYDQKENLKWVKKQLIPMLFRHCNPLFSGRDELKKRNQRFMERIITKSFFCPINRSMKAINISVPKVVSFVGVGCVCVIASSIGAVVIEPKTLTSDNIISHSLFDVDCPLLDVVINPISGQIVGIDSHWVLHLFEHTRSLLKYQLKVEVLVPKASKFLHFDKFGMLWVNLFPQKGSMFLFDTLTLQPSLSFNLENLAQIYHFMRSATTIIPIYFRNQPYGFIGAFSEFPEIYFFSLDFQYNKKFSHPGMKSFPSIKQANQKVFIWSKEGFLFIYELRETVDQIQRIGILTMKSPPTDISATSEPDLIFIACEDYTVHVILGKTTEHPIRLSTARMDKDEIGFCDVLLGPMKFTKSRNQFKEVACYKFSWMPIKIDASSFSDKLVMVVVAFEDSQIGSVFFVNDAQTCKCMDFDSFNYNKPDMSLKLASSNFNDHVANVQKKRNTFLEKVDFYNKFDKKANIGLMNNLFNPSKPVFEFSKFFMSVDMSSVFTFIPNVEPKSISIYEVYHYLTRIGFLPNELSTFKDFLEKFSPDEIKRPLHTIEQVRNILVPVKTCGYYSALVDIKFNGDKINEIIREINPYSNLKVDVSRFTFTKAVETMNDKYASTPRIWLSYFQKKVMNERLVGLTTLEDMVKTEILNRIQKDIDYHFHKNMYNKIQPVPLIDINAHNPKNETRLIEYTKKPNRNPLLDDGRHRCIYDSWSKYILYGRDDVMHIYLRALHVPARLMADTIVQNHFDLVKKVSHACKKISSRVHSFNNSHTDDTATVLVVSEDVKALPLSHYLTIHSYLGGNARLISAVRSIFARVLVSLYQLHKAGIIVRTLYPSNILMNASDLTVKIGNVYDCQQISSVGNSIYLPLPKEFAKDTNPYLPPEYYHEPPNKYTTAFDIWQFGMMLLYVVTGYLPPAYGSELKKHLNSEQLKEFQSKSDPNETIDDPPVYPRAIFFYDWLKDAPVVLRHERNIGDRGECYFTTDNLNNTPGTILNLDTYKLLPFKNTKVNYDESRVFIEIIASCLQIDPSKRPTVEDLLRTYPFNQTMQVNEIFDQYMRRPDPNIFVSQFFSPVLRTLNENNFHFVLGIISSLMFYEDRSEEDKQYSFPLDTRSTERVIESLFQLKFIDKIVLFVLEILESRITYTDVTPTINFDNDCFNSLQRFFMRFVSSVEKGTGALINYTDEIIMSLLSLYAASPHLRHQSVTLKASPTELFDFTTCDSSAVYVFTYSKLHPLIRYALESCPFIMSSLVRSEEHNDQYFSNFLSFSEAIHLFANAMCSPNEKQRANFIKTINGIWANGESIAIVRLFIDFRVPQKIASCYHLAAVRNEASAFICSAFRAVKLRSFDPTYMILQNIISSPVIIHHCSALIRNLNGNEMMKISALEIVRSILFGESAAAISSLVVNDIFFSIAELAKDSTYFNLMNDVISFSSIFVMQIIMSSVHLQHTLRKHGIEFIPQIDYRDLTEIVTLSETIIIAKRLAATLFIRQYPLPVEIGNEPPPIEASADFMIRAINLSLQKCERVARSIDNQVYDVTKFELRGSTMIKARSKAKEAKFANTLSEINDVCDVLHHLFRCLCFYWRHSDKQLSVSLFGFLKSVVTNTIPLCNSIPHPSSKIHHTIQEMILYCFQNLPTDSPVLQLLKDFGDIYPRVMHRDIMFLMSCVDKDIVQSQLMDRYPKERRIRNTIIKTLISSLVIVDYSPIFKVIISEMLYNRTEFKFESTAVLNLQYHYPMRTEAVGIILYVIGLREKYQSAAIQLKNELINFNFIAKERKMTEEDGNSHLVDSSILFLRNISLCYGLFDENVIKDSRILLESLCMRFSREILNIDIFQNTTSETPRKPVKNPVLKETWQRPLTTLPRSAKTSANSTLRTPRGITTRPTTAFSSTAKKIIVTRTKTPR